MNTMDEYIKQPCDRCGSKKRVSKTWKEMVATYTGELEVEYSQIVCTNQQCQAEFDKQILEDVKKREVIRLKKEANDIARKTSSLTQASKAKKAHLA